MNQYDDVRLDVARLLREQDAKLPPHDPAARSADGLGLGGRLRSLARRYATGLLGRLGLYERLIFSNLKLDWFREFHDYWFGELGNRPIAPHDFYYLFGVYRTRFAQVAVADQATDAQHVAAWQDPRNIYQIFAQHYALARQPIVVHRFVKYIPRGGNVCEYGCGLAPIATSIVKYYPRLNIRVTCADIPHIMFHFMRWKFRDLRFIRKLTIDPASDAPLDEMYDIIFCMTVFEHLPRPLAIAEHLTSHLKPGGHLVFNYIATDGTGLDTAAAVRERMDVLKSILDQYEVVEGKIPLDGSTVGTTVVQKRS
jgi:2-polyprenyl-3-methyl-5-hydroxy-6-metoxy-1,4-benzoquinol methylase